MEVGDGVHEASSRKVYFAVFGSGLGHVTRVYDLASRLKGNGYSFRFSTSGQAPTYLRAQGEGSSVSLSPHLDVEWASDGGFSSRGFLPRVPSMVNTFARQVSFEMKSIKKYDPRLVVSDSRLSAVFAARLGSYPVVTILNQFKVAFPPRYARGLGRPFERFAGDVLGSMWALSDQVLMTDLPPPYTIGEATVEGTDVSKVVRYVGFTSPPTTVTDDALARTKKMLDIDERPLIFCQVSGPDETKGRFISAALEAAAGLTEDYNFVVSMSYAGGTTVPRRLKGGGWVFEWCPCKDELFRLADVVVSRAGHRTIGQCIDAGKPAVLVPIHNHPEQHGNAEKYARLGMGVVVRSRELTPSRFAQAARQCLADPRYARNAREVMSVSARYRGIERIAEAVRAFS